MTSYIAGRIAQGLGPFIPMLIAERYLGAYCRAQGGMLAFMFSHSVSFPSIPRMFSGVMIVNGVCSGIALAVLAARVGTARRKYGIELPKLYAEGDGQKAKEFNCVQRGHQQALETYPQFLLLSAFGGLGYPLTTTCLGVLWVMARMSFAAGYATGEPSNRFNSRLCHHIYTPLIGGLATTFATAMLLTDMFGEV